MNLSNKTQSPKLIKNLRSFSGFSLHFVQDQSDTFKVIVKEKAPGGGVIISPGINACLQVIIFFFFVPPVEHQRRIKEYSSSECCAMNHTAESYARWALG